MYKSGRLAGSDQVWKVGMDNWLPLDQVDELSVSPAPAMPSLSGTPLAPPEPVALEPYQRPRRPESDGLMPKSHVDSDIPTYLWQSIVVTLMCCLPLGIVAIVYASKVDSLKYAGDMMGARHASETAGKWCAIAFGVGVLGVVIYLVMMMGLLAGGL
ncbi:CD225/dispanin family protein [Verrucomicrobiaceae bacterium N1E253]|uniref:CD225/dispanin family protein n=2 Tax=Oceaniferula marina TaxID=2748318 RepID=A0A851GPN6_9BACT|nr:CD225/dispanin family protein [Oceaniferula marina]